jgi:predicted P-loop ATPase
MRNFMIASVRRAYKPGKPVEEVYVLQGGQGIGKSTVWEIFGSGAVKGGGGTPGQEKWYDNTLTADVQNKDELLKLRRCWIQEWAELDKATSVTKAGNLKAFITTSMDRYRAPYDREQGEYPRHCMVVASVNKSDFLVDEENRRFCVIPLPQRIDTKRLQEVRNRLWAAAVAAYKAGVPHDIPREIQLIQAEENKAYKEEHPWTPVIALWLETPGNAIAMDSPSGQPAHWTNTSMVLSRCLNIEVARQSQKERRPVSAILRELGWISHDKNIRLPGQGPTKAWYKPIDID